MQEPTLAPRSRSPSKAALAVSRPNSSSHQRENAHAAQRARSPADVSPPGPPGAAPFVPRAPSPSSSPTRPALQTLPTLPLDHAGRGAAPRAAAAAAVASTAAVRPADAVSAPQSSDDLNDRPAVSPAPSLDSTVPRNGYSESYQFARHDLAQNPSGVRPCDGVKGHAVSRALHGIAMLTYMC